MGKERFSSLLTLAAVSVATLEISRYGLTREARKEAGARDHWTCQGVGEEPCYQASLNGGHPARFQDGYWVQLAHYPEKHHLTGKGYHDPDPENARVLCTLCHACEEVDRGNERGARLVLSDGLFSKKHERQTGEQIHITLDEALELREHAREKQAEKEKLIYQAHH